MHLVRATYTSADSGNTIFDWSFSFNHGVAEWWIISSTLPTTVWSKTSIISEPTYVMVLSQRGDEILTIHPHRIELAIYEFLLIDFKSAIADFRVNDDVKADAVVW